MTKKIITGIGIVGILLLSGCTPKQPDLNRGEIKFIKGKAYYIPSYTCWTNQEPEINAVVQSGICKKNGIMWLSSEYVNKYNFPCKAGVSDIIRSQAQSIKQNKSKGLTGCVYPLTKQEYNYRLNQKQEQKTQQNNNMNDIVNSINSVSKNNIEMMKAMNQPSVIYVY